MDLLHYCQPGNWIKARNQVCPKPFSPDYFSRLAQEGPRWENRMKQWENRKNLGVIFLTPGVKVETLTNNQVRAGFGLGLPISEDPDT